MGVIIRKPFQMICHMGTNIIYKPLMTCKHSSSLRCRVTPSHSVCSARLSTGTCSGTPHTLRIKQNKQEDLFFFQLGPYSGNNTLILKKSAHLNLSLPRPSNGFEVCVCCKNSNETLKYVHILCRDGLGFGYQ